MLRMARPRMDYTKAKWYMTKRRMDIILGIMDFKSNQEIANDLGISISSVKNCIHKMLEHHGMKRRHELVGLVCDSRSLMDRIAMLEQRVTQLEER